MDRSFAASAVRVWAAAALALRRSLDVEACGRLRNHAILDALVVLHSRHEGNLPSPRRARRAPPLRAYLESSRRGVWAVRQKVKICAGIDIAGRHSMANQT